MLEGSLSLGLWVCSSVYTKTCCAIKLLSLYEVLRRKELKLNDEKYSGLRHIKI